MNLVGRLPNVRYYLLGVVALMLSACSLFSPSNSDVYVLVSVSGASLPTTVISVTTDDGSLHEVQAVSGRLTIQESGHFSKEYTNRTLENGIPVDTAAVESSGTFVKTDTTLIIHFKPPLQFANSYTYTILHGGLRLRGVEGFFPPRTFEYVKQ